jgi:hypothetical protein
VAIAGTRVENARWDFPRQLSVVNSRLRLIDHVLSIIRCLLRNAPLGSSASSLAACGAGRRLSPPITKVAKRRPLHDGLGSRQPDGWIETFNQSEISGTGQHPTEFAQTELSIEFGIAAAMNVK